MNTRRVWAVAVMLGCSLSGDVASGQSSAGRVTDTSFAVAANSVIDIAVQSGSIVIKGTESAVADLRTNGHAYQLRSSGVSVSLAVTSGATSRGRGTAGQRSVPDIELSVPRGVRLVLRGTSGDVRVSDVYGDVEIQLLSGDIVASALGGRAILGAVSGNIRVTGVGDLRVTTVGGDVVATQVRGAVEIGTTGGDIALSSAVLSRLKVNTVSGDVRVDGAMSNDGTMQITTHSGDVVLQLDDAAAGVLEVSTFRGSVQGSPLTLMPNINRSFTGRQADANVRRYEFGGGGSARITVTTFGGDIVLRRGAQRDNEP